ncbi:hypothetical protein [Corynebacterium freneyi]|uniref:Uncharacterized protein n=1 Tax=Corynebacterium freneyi TaxID=134034 RepID=A0ABS4U9U0_9CORY|nr:hypothetical protein [Corynebacterium freneyi]MBP2333312.1 hypothetical protein [Corynebacterium freneyi]QXA52636.1 hypothetical protein I6L56_11420 [Corynebacterium freneyi]WJZ04584.1 hypothetical protein CFREN_02990 [Corynebacterium freneyi]
MTNTVDRAAAIIAQEWATFSNRDLCGHEIGMARALHREGMLNTAPVEGRGGASLKDVETAREWADDVLEGRAAAIVPIEEAIARALRAYLPPPPRPTLADMTREERAACRRMQADVEGRTERYVIANPFDRYDAVALIGPDWEFDWIEPEYVTPRPDLPRMTWPGDQEAAPTLPEGWRLADHKERGRVIVANDTPNRNGHVTYVLPATDPLGYDWFFCDPSQLTYIDTGKEADQ